MPDLDLLDRVLDWAEAHPDEDHADARGRWHDQDVWVAEEDCGTACCIAGIVALSEGWQPVYPVLNMGAEWVDRAGEMALVSEVARRALGLSYEEADALFRASNTLPVLRRLAKELRNGDPIDVDLARSIEAGDV